MNKFLALLGFDPAKHSVRVEMLAGLTTFLTMSYILVVNPLILGETGMDKGALFSATVVSAVIATLVMAFYAKMPFALDEGLHRLLQRTLTGHVYPCRLLCAKVRGPIAVMLNNKH